MAEQKLATAESDTLQKIYLPPIPLLGLATGCSVLGIALITPALPLIGDALGASASAVQLLLTIYMAVLAITQLIIGPFSDLFGRRPFMILGALALMVGGFIGYFAQDMFSLTIGRIIQGLGAGACLAMARAMINDALDRQNAAKAMASVQTMHALVPIFGLMVGGVIVTLFGWQGAMAVITAAGVLLTMLFPIYVRETHLKRGAELRLGFIFSAYHQVLRTPLFLGFCVVAALQVGIFLSMNAFLPYLYSQMGASALEFGFWFALTPVCYFLGNLINRLYLVHKGIERAALIGCALTVIALSLLLAIQYSGLHATLPVALICALFGLGNGLCVANVVIGGIKSAGSYGGTASGLIGAMQMFAGGGIGALIIGFGGNVDTIFATQLVLIAGFISLVAVLFVYRQR